jgi:hypothetical protein
VSDCHRRKPKKLAKNEEQLYSAHATIASRCARQNATEMIAMQHRLFRSAAHTRFEHQTAGECCQL